MAWILFGRFGFPKTFLLGSAKFRKLSEKPMSVLEKLVFMCAVECIPELTGLLFIFECIFLHHVWWWVDFQFGFCFFNLLFTPHNIIPVEMNKRKMRLFEIRFAISRLATKHCAATYHLDFSVSCHRHLWWLAFYDILCVHNNNSGEATSLWGVWHVSDVAERNLLLHYQALCWKTFWGSDRCLVPNWGLFDSLLPDASSIQIN